MFPKRRLPQPFHFEQPFAVGGGSASEGDAPVVGAIVTGPLGALIQRAFHAAFTAVARASAAQKLAAAEALATHAAPSAGKPARAKVRRRSRARRRPGDPGPH